MNKLISKIPVLGDIVIQKLEKVYLELDFKMKEKAGKIKTTINPIETITPEFLQKIIDKTKVLNNF